MRIPKTKIIATVGPSSSNTIMLRKMFISGLDMVRLNFSHGSHLAHTQNIKRIRVLNKKMRRSIKIMQDLEGYRIRIGMMAQDISLAKNSTVKLVCRDIIGTEKWIPFDYRGPLGVIKPGSLIYIDDGKIILKVTARRSSFISARVITGGLLREKKGINIPGVDLVFETLTEKDKKDLSVAIDFGLDFVAQSFVRDAKDIILVRDFLKAKGSKIKIFAKVENQKALLNLDEIIDEADGVIVARGDLGICLPIYEVPIIQKEIVKRCCLKNKPVVVATQMLDSMTVDTMPTRAEVCDVANAILDGATHLMLSAETAIGKHPHRVIDMMNKVIKSTENYQKKPFFF